MSRAALRIIVNLVLLHLQSLTKSNSLRTSLRHTIIGLLPFGVVLLLVGELHLVNAFEALDFLTEHPDGLLHLFLVDLMLVVLELVLVIFERTAQSLNLLPADLTWADG